MSKPKRPKTIFILVALLVVQAVSGILGGVLLTIRPDGSLLRQPVSWLEHSPFTDYLVPGLILLFILGGLPLLVAYALLKTPGWRWPSYLNVYPDQFWGWSFATYVGFGLVIWIAFEVSFIRVAHPLQTVYALLGVAISAWSLLPSVRNAYRHQ